MVMNTTSSRDGVYVKVSCTSGYQLSALQIANRTQGVFYCMGSGWFPSMPRCIVASSNVPVGIIVGCTLGGIVCLAIILVALFMLYRTRGEGIQEKQNDMLQQNKKMHIDFFMTAFQQDNVGMPVVHADAQDTDLRGVTSSCAVMSNPDAEQIEYSMSEAVRRGSIDSTDSITSAGDMANE
jgi:hypothetical protein